MGAGVAQQALGDGSDESQALIETSETAAGETKMGDVASVETVIAVDVVTSSDEVKVDWATNGTATSNGATCGVVAVPAGGNK